MDAMTAAVNHVIELVRRRASVLFGRKGEAGALSLEWLVIAVALVAAAGIAYALFRGAIRAEARKLP